MGTVKKIPMRKCVGCGEMKNKKGFKIDIKSESQASELGDYELYEEAYEEYPEDKNYAESADEYESEAEGEVFDSEEE